MEIYRVLKPGGQPQFWNLPSLKEIFRTSVSFLFSERTSAPGRVGFQAAQRRTRISQVCRKVPCTRDFQLQFERAGFVDVGFERWTGDSNAA